MPCVAGPLSRPLHRLGTTRFPINHIERVSSLTARLTNPDGAVGLISGGVSHGGAEPLPPGHVGNICHQLYDSLLLELDVANLANVTVVLGDAGAVPSTRRHSVSQPHLPDMPPCPASPS